MRYRYRLSLLIWLVLFSAGCHAPEKRTTTVPPFCPTTWNAHIPPAQTAQAKPIVTQPVLATGLARLPVVVVTREKPESPADESKVSHEILQATFTQIPLNPPTLIEDREVVWTAVKGP